MWSAEKMFALKESRAVDYTLGYFIEEAIHNYDVSDMINQIVIICLVFTLIFQSCIRIKFSRRTYY